MIANVEVQVSEDSELRDPKSAGDDVHCFGIAFTLLSLLFHIYIYIYSSWVICFSFFFARVLYFVLLQAVRFLPQNVQYSISSWHGYYRNMMKRHDISTDSQQNVRHIADTQTISLSTAAILGAGQQHI